MKKNNTQKNRMRLFLENMFVYGVGSAIGKLIPFLLLPVITRMMPSSYYYGISDLVDVIVSFGASFSVMGLYDIMFRVFFDKDEVEYKKKVCSSTLHFVVLNAAVLSGILILLRKFIARIILGDVQYDKLVIIAACSIFFSAMSLIISAPTRMQNQKVKYLVVNMVIPIVSYGCSMLLLKIGAYEYALPIVTLCNYLLMTLVFLLINHSFFELGNFDWKLVKDMLILGIPLVPNFVIYWIFNSSDRLMINYFRGTEAAGIYAVGAKMGHLSQLIYTAFAGGWQYFAFSTMKDDDQVELTSRVFEYLGVLTFGSGIAVTVCSKIIFSVLFPKSYGEAYRVMPYLFIAPLLLMLYQTAGNQFLIIKKTWPTMLILAVGAVGNLMLNYLLIPTIGIEGAAIGTLIGYVISVVVCVMVLKRMQLIQIRKRFIVCCGIMVLFLTVWRIFIKGYDIIYWIGGFGAILFIGILYINDIKRVIRKLGKGGE